MTPTESDEPEGNGSAREQQEAHRLIAQAGADPAKELDLVDVGASLWRRWKLMAGVFAICFGLGIAYAFTRTPAYTYRAVMRVGTIYAIVPMSAHAPSRQPLIRPASVSAELNYIYVPRILNEAAARGLTFTRSLKINVNLDAESNMIVLAAVASSARGPVVAGLLSRIVASGSAEINVRLAAYIRRERKYLENEIARIKQRENSLEAQALSLSRNPGGDAAAASYVAAQVATLTEYVAVLRRDRDVMLLSNIEEAGLVGKVTKSPAPVGLGRAIKVIAGGVAGVVLALLAAALANYLAAVRLRIRAGARSPAK